MNLLNNKYINYVKNNIVNYINSLKYNIFNTNNKLKLQYLDWLLNTNYQTSKNFVPETDKKINYELIKTKLIAFYLPQYYANQTNNENFGKGFMEWYNTTKTIPQYTGHYQPHLPIDVGFYDLTHDDIMYRQIELAKKYGVYGFCFYYYWFSGDRLLDKPVDNFLNNKELNIPFCLFWANETWSHLWDNGDYRNIIKKQELRDDDDDKFVQDIIKYFNDSRYIKIKNKPLLIIYKSQIFETKRFKRFLGNLRTKIKNFGFEGIHLMITDSGAKEIDMNEFGFDSIVEFSHRNITINAIPLDMKNRFVNPNFKGQIFDINKALKKKKHLICKYKNLYRCVCAGWDNSARKAYSGAEIFHMTPKDFKVWLKDTIEWTQKNHSREEQIVFIDSWNEWAEGAHLEPDQHYGYAYLQSTKEALEETI